jgi:hypothetical protein
VNYSIQLEFRDLLEKSVFYQAEIQLKKEEEKLLDWYKCGLIILLGELPA